MRKVLLAAAAACAPIVSVAAAPAPEVDLALVLAVDVSQSMDNREQHLQRDGYVRAFRTAQVLAAITQGPIGRIAVTYVEWSSLGQQDVVVPWTVIDGALASLAFANALAAAPIHPGSETSISQALLFSAALLDKNEYLATRRAIDISGDGPNGQGVSVTVVRDTVAARGITINGLPISLPGQRHIPDIDEYYANCVIGGPSAFLFTINDLSQLPEAIRQKLVLEIASAPFPPQPLLRRTGASSIPCD